MASCASVASTFIAPRVNSLQLYVEQYKDFVKKNPLVASELEVALKWISYFAAGRFTRSAVLSELIHSVSNLLTLVNDSILRKAAHIPVHAKDSVEKLLTTLSVIEYVEVFVEVAARQLGGTKSKWALTVIIQLTKTCIRLILLLHYKQGINLSPPIPPLNRRVDVPQLCNGQNGRIPPSVVSPNVEVSFTLKRSGRTIRSLESAPPLSGRTWKPLKTEIERRSRKYSPTQLQDSQLAGEIIHIARPLTHLVAMRMFGTSSWKPWLVSLAMDLSSLRLLCYNDNKLNYVEKLEISRRALLLLLYILRSPFYEQFSKKHLTVLLSSLADVRVLGLVVRPLMEYLPEWQKMYFYTWAT